MARHYSAMLKDVYSFADLQNWTNATVEITPPIRLAVTGDPIAHSASPRMHNAALQELGISMRYTRLHLLGPELAAALPLLVSNDFIGLNVTIPHKTAILPLLDTVSEHARKIGAVNTVAIREDKLHGFNTDGPGLVRAIKSEFDADIRDLRVMVLGAGGGAGRAIATQCAIENCPRLVLVNRTIEKANDLAQELKGVIGNSGSSWITAIPFATPELETELKEIDLVINATSMGMKPGESSPLSAPLMKARHLVYDTIYTAERTPLMRAADQAGAKCANGFSMLLHQGALAFEIWFEREAPLEVMRQALLNK